MMSVCFNIWIFKILYDVKPHYSEAYFEEETLMRLQCIELEMFESV